MTAAPGELVEIAPEPPYVRPATVRVIIGGEIQEFPNPEPTFVPTTRAPSSYCQACNVDFAPAGSAPADDRTPQSHRRTWLCVGCDVATPVPSGDAWARFGPIDPVDGTIGHKPWPAAEVLARGGTELLTPKSGPALFAAALAPAGWTAEAVRTRGPWQQRGGEGFRIAEALSVRGTSPTGHRAAAVWVSDAAGAMKGEYCALQLRGDRVREVGLDPLKDTLRALKLPPAPKAARPAKTRKAPGAAVGGPTAPVQVPAAVEVPPAAAEPAVAALEAMQSAAELSLCGQYRYALLRRWAEGPAATFVMLNPSTADAEADDPTIRRCISFAKAWGCGALRVVNLYAYRSTDPKALLTCADPVGPENDTWLARYATAAAEAGSPLIAAWGAHGKADRVQAVLSLPGFGALRSLGTTQAGAPRHPLYVKADTTPAPWPETVPAAPPEAAPEPVQASVAPGLPPAVAEPAATVQVPAATVPKPRTRKAAASKPATGRSRGAAYARGEAHEDVCGGCKRPILRGLDNDVAAADAVADPVLGWASDSAVFRRAVVALLMGRPVYAYDRRRLWAMDRHTLSRPGWHRVALAHICADPFEPFPIPTNQGERP